MWRHILENKMTWAWYNIVISSGAVSLLLFELPFRVHRLWVLGAIVYIFSLILFLFTLLVHIVRFLVRPSLFPESITHPQEGGYVSSLPAALGMVLINGATYAHKLHGYNAGAMRTFFWIFTIFSLLSAFTIPITHFSSPTRRPRDPLTHTLPLLLAGPAAASVLAHLPSNSHHHAALGIFAFAVILQGLGLGLSFMTFPPLLAKLHTDGFPAARDRPQLFLASLPASLSAWAATSLAQQALRHFPTQATAPGGDPAFVVGGVALYYMGITTALLFWGVAAWWFVVATAGCIGVLGELGLGCGGVVDGFGVVLAHAALFLGTNGLLKAFAWPKGLSVLNEILGVATAGVWAVLLCAAVAGVVTGRWVRE